MLEKKSKSRSIYKFSVTALQLQTHLFYNSLA